MADDAGALLVRSGLVSSSALDDARARVASIGGTLGEQLVTSGAIADDALTDFYRSRLLVPVVNPNMLARLTPNVVATIPGDMAIELRAIPVSIDGDNNLTVAMSDPSDRHAVDEIAFFTGAYVVRAVATQMQIAWCLAHYYGHVTALGQRLLRVAQSEPVKPAPSTAARRTPRTKGLTGKVNATRHRAIAPITGPVDVLRPSSGQLDLRPHERAAGPPGAALAARASLASASLGASASASGAMALAEAALADMAGPSRSDDAPLTVPGFVRPNPLMAAGATDAVPEAMDLMVASGALPMVAIPVLDARDADARDSDDAVTEVRVAESGPRATQQGVIAGPAARARVPPAPGVAVKRAGATPAPGIAVKRAGATPAPTRSRSTPNPDGVSNPSLTLPGVMPAAAAGPAGAARAGSPPPAAAGPAGAARAGAPPPAAAARPAADPPRVQVPVAGPNTPTLVPSNAPAISSSPPPGIPTAPLAAVLPPIDDEPSAPISATAAPDGAPEKPRARSVSGEIRVPVRRAPSIKPPLPAPDSDDDEEEPLIMIEMREEDDDVTGPRPLPIRRRPIVKSDPPELYARAGEVDLKDGADRAIDADEPRIVVDEDAFAPPTGRIDTRAALPLPAEPTMSTMSTIDFVEDAGSGAVIHDRLVDHDDPGADAAPRARGTPGELDGFREDEDDSDTGEIDVVMLDAPKKHQPEHRPERRTKMGIGPSSAATHTGRGAAVEADDDPDEPTGPTLVDPGMAERVAEVIGDATSVDLAPAPPGEDTSSDQLAAPPSPSSDDDTNPHVVAAPPPPLPAPPARATRSGQLRRAVLVEDDDDDDDDGEPRGPRTSEMTAAELDDAIPERSEFVPILRRRLEHDAVDDGWGPPGTTIPPPLLGAIPGSEDDDETASAIPMLNVDSSPLLVAPPVASPADPGGRTLARALEDATARAIDVIRLLEHTQSRDEIVQVMIAHLAETHHRAGFFVTKHAVSKDAGELGLFALQPRPVVMPSATLRLDRPSTLQDVVGTRLPYRGPMHDDASRAFLVSVLGACPAEILLVPVTVRERVVGVLFGEHRQRHTFDDQLALAARAAGMALERILRSRRG